MLQKVFLAVVWVLCVVYCGSAANISFGYKEVPYIESSGMQWIDTGFAPSNATRIEARIKPLACAGAWHSFFGVWHGDRASLCLRYNGISSDINAIFGGDYSGNATYKLMTDKCIDVSIKHGSVTLNGETRSLNTNGCPKSGSNIYIFGNHTDKGATGLQPMQLYYMKIFEGDKIVRDFIPVCDRDGKAGLWECVEKRFYTNCGTGEFIVPIVSSDITNRKVPSKKEIAAVKKSMSALLSTDISPEELLRMANESESSAEVYHLYGHAFILQCKQGKGDEAAETLRSFRDIFEDIPASTLVSLIEKNATKLLKESIMLEQEYKRAKKEALVNRQIESLTASLKKKPLDEGLNRKLGEAYAANGEWRLAFQKLEKGGEDLRENIKAEKLMPTMKVAAFWWDYKPSFPPASTAFKLHAATIYKNLLETETLSVIEKTIAEKRIEQAAMHDADGEGYVSDGKPNNELVALKKICNMKGLIHCWRFNGDLKDCVGRVEAKQIGKVEVLDKIVTLPGGHRGTGHIQLGEGVIETDNDSVTVELWCAQDKVVFWGRIFTFGEKCMNSFQMVWAWAHDYNTDLVTFRNGRSIDWKCILKPYELHQEYHIAMVIERVHDNFMMHVYKQDVNSGATIGRLDVALEKGWSWKNMQQKNFWLGTCADDDRGPEDSCASYNEVRIWNRALSEEELTQNAIKFHKAGETMKK